MKRKSLIFLLITSLAVNLFVLGRWLIIEQWLEPSAEEKIILSEMVQKTVDSEEYQQLSEQEEIISIETDLNKFRGGEFPYYFAVSVNTDEETYLFTCRDKQCTDVENAGWTYSRYEAELPRLPLAK